MHEQMLRITLSSGEVVERVFCGYIASKEELVKFNREMEEEIAENHTGNPLLCEIWKNLTNHKSRKREIPNVQAEMAASMKAG